MLSGRVEPTFLHGAPFKTRLRVTLSGKVPWGCMWFLGWSSVAAWVLQDVTALDVEPSFHVYAKNISLLCLTSG